MSNDKSCVGCKYLYSEGVGYSNSSWLETDIRCAIDVNKNLPRIEPLYWKKEPDNWPATNDSRCVLYSPLDGRMVEMDIDGDEEPGDFTQDEEAILAILKHSDR